MQKFRVRTKGSRSKIFNRYLKKRHWSRQCLHIRYDAVYSDDVWSDEHENNAVFDKKSLEFQSARFPVPVIDYDESFCFVILTGLNTFRRIFTVEKTWHA